MYIFFTTLSILESLLVVRGCYSRFFWNLTEFFCIIITSLIIFWMIGCKQLLQYVCSYGGAVMLLTHLTTGENTQTLC